MRSTVCLDHEFQKNALSRRYIDAFLNDSNGSGGGGDAGDDDDDNDDDDDDVGGNVDGGKEDDMHYENGGDGFSFLGEFRKVYQDQTMRIVDDNSDEELNVSSLFT